MILLNAQSDRASIFDAFEAGARDVVLAPASADEVYARTMAALHGIRSTSERFSNKTSITLGHYVVDRTLRSVVIGGRKIKLTEKELEMIWLLFLHKNEEVSRKHISMVVWGTEKDIVSRSIEQYIYRLRCKLELDGTFGIRLQTLHARGYRIVEIGPNEPHISNTNEFLEHSRSE
ncbi:response regulator transcription factor [Burkholderia ubonensis]|uniref:response regulator transcription factor n=1 Tax=Burkholderia ubonensis TaxID=101571 RepID=UPI000B127643|nr:response regulator transcription factor [Burkholderia ubonensis]